MRGRRPKPSALKRIEGNPGGRRINKSEPKPTGVADCPAQLDARAKAEWDRVSGQLIAMGLLTPLDRAALAAYCSSWSMWITAEENIAKFGMVIKSPKSGLPVRNPYSRIANNAMDQMRKFLIEFGMTPASRSRIHVGDGLAPTDSFEAFMKGIGGGEPDDK